GRVDDHLRRLPQAGVNHFHTGIAQRAGNHLGAAIVAVQARLSDEDADFAVGRHSGISLAKTYHGDTEARRKTNLPQIRADERRSLFTIVLMTLFAVDLRFSAFICG